MANSEALLKHFELARRDLLELTTQNRLLATPRDQESGACIEIKDESTTEVFRQLVTDLGEMQFEEGVLVEGADAATDVEASDADANESEAESQTESSGKSSTKKSTTAKSASRRTTKKAAAVKAATTKAAAQPVDVTDDVLHTDISPEELDRRLVSLVSDATASLEEKGVNVLYLAMGFLRWYEDETSETPRDAPLLLIPVSLERGRTGGRYKLKLEGEVVETNLTLAARLKLDFGLDLPAVPELEELSPAAYFSEVQKAVAGQRRWEVRPDDMVLWFFSFSKLLMYRDLDPANWPADKRLEDRPLIRGLLQDGFSAVKPLCGENDNIDSLFDPVQTMHVIDCDSSQSLVVEEAARGCNLVIQGPPGTGKSQTITNLISSAVANGKTILFVAEKMAALEVVKRRLDNIGIGDMCLELHSKLTNRRVVLQELDRTLKLGTPKLPDELDVTVKKLKGHRDELNGFVELLHTPCGPGGRTPYEILVELIDLRADQTPLPDFQLPEAAKWKADEYERNLQAVTDLSRVMVGLGNPDEHPWRGSHLNQVLPLDLERLLVAIPKRLTEIDELTEPAHVLSSRLGDDPPVHLTDIDRLLKTVDTLLSAPELDTQPMGGTVWVDHRQAIQELADYAASIIKAKEELQGKVSEAAWELNVAEDRQAYALYGKSMFRIFRSSYRKARRTLKGLLTGPQPETFEARLNVFDLLNNRRIAMKKLAEAGTFGEKAFGRHWLGPQTDWKRIVAWNAWDAAAVKGGVSNRFRTMLGLVDKPDEIRTQAATLRQKMETFVNGFIEVCKALQIDFPTAFGKSSPVATGGTATSSLQKIGSAADTPLASLRERLVAWQSNPEGLQSWQTYRQSHTAVAPIGEGVLVEKLTSGEIDPSAGPAVFRFAVAEAVLRQMFKDRPQLESFDGGRFEQLIEEFCSFDIKRLELARAEVAEKHWVGIGRPRGEGMGSAVALLRHEMQKKRRHLQLRELLERAGQAVQAIKPVFMMSPLSVAQYLKPGAIEFDMLLIDEASQVRPVEALGAAARCRQMVVVGDDKQMPPTQFFGKVIGDVDMDADAPEMQAGDVESILGLCIARNMPQRMLRWHYRSKHESLIAVSNREFYENQLYIIPSPENQGKLGVKHQYIEGAVFKSGKNVVEAKIVAEAIMQHARENPKWTLGVAAFSVTQRDAILKELENLRKDDRSADAFFDPNAPDPFFVKNLENVQGDERDVIFVSVGYGPGEDGKVSLNFGPVSSSGGERRLNVLMTRAKRVLKMFASLRAEDIDLSRATGRGPEVLREYLRFAQSGGDVEGVKSSTPKDRFVEVLQRQLKERGIETRTHVGVAGVFVDLAVIDPENEGRYVLGIEVDGSSFRAARSSRDRCRTRDGVLGAQGWAIHHVWSIEYFKRPTEQFNRIIEAIDAAKKGRLPKRGGGLASTVSTVTRTPGGIDPLATAVTAVELVPSATASATTTSPKEESSEGISLGDILSTGLKIGAAALTAEKGKGLDAAISAFGRDDKTPDPPKKKTK
ncbi:MAG: DUF4011 domain-containing protein [Planctomycetaceae bacterium]